MEGAMNPLLAEKVAIVTGAGQGLGEAIALALADAGACVAVNDLNPDRAERVAGLIMQRAGQAVAIPADIASKFQCVHLIEETRARWGRLDILVNNAAITPEVSLLKMDEWEWNRCLDVNLKGTFFMSQLAGRVMAEENRERGGAIVNIGAVAPPEAPGLAAYYASKAGVAALGRACAMEYADYGIRVNTIMQECSGRAAETESSAGDVEVAGARRQRRECLDGLAPVVLFLCSEAGRSISGSTLTIGRGWATQGA
jgi:NAD(P)-dependent dehydrogenase (short-subunit alcohol dehydrogenase family)